MMTFTGEWLAHLRSTRIRLRVPAASSVVLVGSSLAVMALAGCVAPGTPTYVPLGSGSHEVGPELWSLIDPTFANPVIVGNRLLTENFTVDAEADLVGLAVHASGILADDAGSVSLAIIDPSNDTRMVVDAHDGGADDHGTIRSFFRFDRIIDEPAEGNWTIDISAHALDLLDVQVRGVPRDIIVKDAAFVIDRGEDVPLRIIVGADGSPSGNITVQLFDADVFLTDEWWFTSPDTVTHHPVGRSPGEYTLRLESDGYAGAVNWRVERVVPA